MSDRADTGLLRICDVSARFDGQKGYLEALDGVSFDLQRGDFVCLIGPSGCGKSTLLRIVAGLLPPTEGHVVFEDRSPRPTGQRVGLVFQNPALMPWRNVRANVALPLELNGTPAAAVQAQTDHLLALVGLSGFEAAYPIHLSGGMAQRTAIARALAQNPKVLLLDEPFGALDALTRERMAEELLRIWRRDQRTVLMVTHSVEEAALLADRVIVLSTRPGRVVGDVRVTLPRPRSRETLTTPALQRIARELRRLLAAGEATTPPT